MSAFLTRLKITMIKKENKRYLAKDYETKKQNACSNAENLTIF